MEKIKFILDSASNTYSYAESSTVEMLILGEFFTYNYFGSPHLGTWVEKAKNGEVVRDYALKLEVQQGDLLLKDRRSKEEEPPMTLRMKKNEFIKLYYEWQNAVCKVSILPEELAIIYEKGEYRLEVKKKRFSFRNFIRKCLYKIRYFAWNKESTGGIVKLVENSAFRTYSYKEESNKEMFILGQLFSGNFSYSSSYLCTWAEKKEDGEYLWTNGIRLEIQQDDILLRDRGKIPAEMRMKKNQFITLCNEWINSVCRVLVTPKELAIIYKNDQYRLEVTRQEFSFKFFIRKWALKIGYPIFNEEKHTEIVKFIHHQGYIIYSYIQPSNIEMFILGIFFESHFSCNPFFYYDWMLQAEDGDIFGGDYINLEIEEDHAVLQCLYPAEGEAPAEVRMKKEQFIKLCGEWLQNVYEAIVRPKELAIVYESGEYRLEIKKEPSSLNTFMHRWFY